ncbi:phage tail sheath family protein [Chitinophagaceae bacterium MMS25-I14]
MATSYKTPGVYIEEIPKLPPSIAEVETAIPAFIGYTQTAGIAGAPLKTDTINGITVTEAYRITSLLEYETYFGTGPNETYTISIDETYTSGTPSVLKSRTISASVASPSVHTMYYHMQLYFANGGGPCYIISVGNTTAGTIAGTNILAGLEMAKRYDEPTLLVAPQATSLGDSDMYSFYQQAMTQAANLQDRFAVMDVKKGSDLTHTQSDFRTGVGSNNLKYGAAYYPFLRTTINYRYDLTTTNVRWKLDLNDDGDHSDAGEHDGSTDIAYSALTTELQGLVKQEMDKQRVTLPPSAAVVGVYAAVDSSRGVWKAPANVSLSMVSGLTDPINELDQANFNVDADTGKSINVIRAFTGRGIMIWGARTLAGNDNEWRYIPVRRFFNMVEESTKKATEGFVFEPNDANTWVKVQGMIENFLTTQWRNGALQGAKPEQAFYVSVGLNKTMTALDILEGRMIVEIGMAVVRPAEFIILRFSHKMAES